jgi:hypothetical protein
MEYYIWGAGDSGIELAKKYRGGGWYNIKGFIDSNPVLWKRKIFNLAIISPSEFALILNENTRVIISAIENFAKAEIYNELIKIGIDKTRIIFECGGYYDIRFEYVRQFAKYVYDQGIKGNTGECGVAGGFFAAKINRCFYDRKLYLFDTFKGFDERDIIAERKIGNSDFIDGVFNKVGLFNNTSVDKVMSNMPFADNIIIKEGYVPESFYVGENINDTFCFINLDMDLHLPMLGAMKFFWDKMVQGGIILCHDYYCPSLPNVKKAVCDFEKHLGRFILKTPIGDNCSIALIKD